MFRKAILVSEVVKVTDITGIREHKTLKGEVLSPVFYEAVKEYHDFLANASFESARTFVLSQESTQEVIDRIQTLAIKLNGNVLPEDLTILPKELYSSLLKEDFKQIILATSLPPEGSQSRENYDSLFKEFTHHVTRMLANAYRLPTNLNSNSYNIQTTLELVEPRKQVEKKLSRLLAVKRTNIFLVFLSSYATVVGSLSLLSDPYLWVYGGMMGVIFGGVSTVMVISSAELKENKKGALGFVWGIGSNKFKETKLNFKEHVKPQLASMESYLLQEGSAVEELFTVQRKETLVLGKSSKPLSGLQKRIAEGKADPISNREREQLEEIRAIYKKRFGRDIEEALSSVK